MAGGRALVFDCWLTAKGISLPGVRTRAERQELRTAQLRFDICTFLGLIDWNLVNVSLLYYENFSVE